MKQRQSGASKTVSRVGFRDIADALRKSIEAGEIAKGSSLPSESDLISRHGVARTTVRRALALLEEEGLIEVVPGRGRFVRGAEPGTARTEKKYEQVAEEIRRQLTSVPTSAGERVGTVDELVERFAVSTWTVRRALTLLQEEGLITAVHGQAWFAGDLGDEANRTAALAGRLRAAIAAGTYPVGGALPGEMILADEHGVARNTVRRALTLLEAEGLIETRPGQGRRVLALPGGGGQR